MEFKRYLILFFAFLLVANVMTCQLVERKPIKLPDICSPTPTSKKVYAPELEGFLVVWSKYVAKGYNAEVLDAISLASEQPSEKVGWKIKYWLSSQCWDVDRFFYVEQRVRSMVHTLYLQKHTAEVVTVLNEQLKMETNQARIQNYKEMIALQDAVANIENIGNEELLAVRGREELIENVLNGQVEYKSNGDK